MREAYRLRHYGIRVEPLLIIDAQGNPTLCCLTCQEPIRLDRRSWVHYHRTRWTPRRLKTA